MSCLQGVLLVLPSCNTQMWIFAARREQGRHYNACLRGRVTVDRDQSRLLRCFLMMQMKPLRCGGRCSYRLRRDSGQ